MDHSNTQTTLQPGEYLVGTIEGYPVIYVKQRDVVFCKNTAVKHSILKKIWDSTEDRHKIEEKSLTIVKDTHFIMLGCLTTDHDNCKSILKNIKRIKDE